MALEQYDLARKRASQQAEADKQAQGDALKRRFAAMGNLNSGAYVKQQNAVDDQVAQRRDQANEGINAAEASEVLRRKELQDNRDFSSAEAQKGRDFQGSENALQRAYGTSERLGSQEFGAGQNALQRLFQTSERLGSQEYGSNENALQRRFMTSEREGSQAFADSQRIGSQDFAAAQSALARELQKYGIDLQNTQFGQQLAQQGYQFDKQFGLDEAAQKYNMMAADRDFYKPTPSAIEGLLGIDSNDSIFSKLGSIFSGGMF